jgi:uncharacterized protein
MELQAEPLEPQPEPVEPPAEPLTEEMSAEPTGQDSMREETKAMPVYEQRTHTQPGHTPAEGVTVVGEAVRRVSPESAELLVEITASAPTAAQALRENHLKTTHMMQAVAASGVQPADVQTISFNVYSLFAPLMHSLPAYGAMPQIGPAMFPTYAGAGAPSAQGGQSEIQFGSYQARSTLRVNVREAARAGEVVDALTKAGVTVAGAFSLKVSDEAQARRTALEAAARDARAKAEALASAAGKQIGDATSISEEVVATNGAYAALRAALPYSFGAGAPQIAGELEYYARVSANFRLV